MVSPTGKQSDGALASNTSLIGKSKWTSEITVEFVPLPKEKEEAYWAALQYFAGLMQRYMQEECQIHSVAEFETVSG